MRTKAVRIQGLAPEKVFHDHAIHITIVLSCDYDITRKRSIFEKLPLKEAKDHE